MLSDGDFNYINPKSGKKAEEKLHKILDGEFCDNLEEILYNSRNQVNFEPENIAIWDEFNMPNYSTGFDKIKNIPIIWIAAGGDWELPIALILYLDKEYNIKVFIPKEGNSYNTNTNSAFGNEMMDGLDEVKKYGFKYEFDKKLMKKEFLANINRNI